MESPAASPLSGSRRIPLAMLLLAGSALSTPAIAQDITIPDNIQSFSEALDRDEGAVRTAQLEWLFGRPQSQRQYIPRAERSYDDRGYNYRSRQDNFGNNTPGDNAYVRPVPRNQSRMRDDGTFVVKVDPKTDRIRHKVADKLRAAPPAPPTKGPLLITVSLSRQQLTLYDQGVPIATSPVSSGSRGHETPTGVFSVLQKQYFHRSNMYSSAPMPYMQRITWSGVALHGGELPGYAASHGCIRLPEAFAIRLWGTTQPGVRVIVTQNEVKPVDISHDLLFKPKAVQVNAPAPSAMPPSVPTPQVAPPSKNAPQPQPVTPRTLPSPEVMQEPSAKNASADDLVGTSQVSLREQIADSVPMVAEVTLVRGGQVVQTISRLDDRGVASNERGMRSERITVIRGGQPTEFQIVDMPPVSAHAIAAAPAEAAVGQVALDNNDDDNVMSDAPSFALPDINNVSPVLLAYNGNDFMQFAKLQRRAAPEPQSADVQPSAARMLRAGPVAIYISRREQRIYVRKAFEPVFDMPITVSDAGSPMGTHVFTANALIDNGKAFRWSVVSLNDGQFGRRSSSDDGKAARAALDRIQLPQDAVSRISELVDVGATLIVTDKGPGSGRYSQTPDNDFSVVTR